MDNKDNNDKKRLSRVELYDSPKSQKHSFLSRKRASRSATPINDESSNTVHSRRRQIVDRPQKSHHRFFNRPFKGRHKGKLYKTVLFALLGILVVMIIIFAVKQQHPVNTDSTDTSVSSSSSSHHSRKHKRSHSSSSDDNENYGDSDNQATYQVPASRSDNTGTSSQGTTSNNQGGTSSNQSNQSNNNNQSGSQNQSSQQQQTQQPSNGNGQSQTTNNKP